MRQGPTLQHPAALSVRLPSGDSAYRKPTTTTIAPRVLPPTPRARTYSLAGPAAGSPPHETSGEVSLVCCGANLYIGTSLASGDLTFIRPRAARSRWRRSQGGTDVELDTESALDSANWTSL